MAESPLLKDSSAPAAGHGATVHDASRDGSPPTTIPLHGSSDPNTGPSRNPSSRTCGCSDKSQRRLVVCIDGTSNQFGDKNTNVIELYKLLKKKKGDKQLTYYNSGIGTYAQPSSKTLSYYKRWFGHKLDLAIAWNFEHIIIGAYHWLSENYQHGDCIFLFGFSRGAYQVRTLSAMIHKVGLIHRGNEAQIPFAYQLYADPKSGIVPSSRNNAEELETLIPQVSPAETFKSTFSRDVKVHFIGAWDTVSSIGVVRARHLLPHTIDGMEHVCFFRHALALDERRVKFLPEYAYGGYGPWQWHGRSDRPIMGDVKEVWFAGTHSDVGGGNEENPHLDRTRPSLRWMFAEASVAGLHFEPFKRKFDDVDVIKVGEESLVFLWRAFEHLPFRRLTYGEGGADRLWWDNRWILVEVPVCLVWMLVEVILLLLWLLWMLVLLVLKLVQLVLMVLRVDWRGLRSQWRVLGSQCDELWKAWRKLRQGNDLMKTWWAKDTHSWLPHRSKGRVIREGQKIHTSVWRSQNLGTAKTTTTHRPIHRIVYDFVLFSLLHLEPSNYIPRARLLSQPDFWERFGQLNNDNPKALDPLKMWKEVDLYDSVEDLVNQYMSHQVVGPDDDTERILRTMINIHFTSRNGRRALLMELLKHLKSDKPRRAGAVCKFMEAMMTSTDVHPVLCKWGMIEPWLLRYFEKANEAEHQVAQKFLTQLTDPIPGLTGHESAVYSVAFSPDGKHIASGSSDGTIRIWDAETGMAVGEPFKGHDGVVNSVAFSPNSKHVVSGSFDKTIRIWNVETGQPIGKSFEGHSSWVYSVAFSPDGERIVSGSRDETLRIWDAKTGQTVGEPLKGHAGSVRSVAYSPDGTRVVSGSSDHTVRIWDAATGQIVGSPLEGHTSSVLSVAFSPDGKRIVSGSYDDTIRIWDVRMGQVVGEPLKGHSDTVTSVAFSPNGKHIVSGSDDKTVRIWDAETGTMVGKPYEGHTSYVDSVAFSPDGKRVVSGSWDKTIRIWDVLEPLRPLAPEAEVPENAVAGPSNTVTSPLTYPSTIP